MDKSKNPLRARPPKEIHLDNAPLLRVIGQIRFPPIESMNQGEFIAPFQEDIRRQYPVLRKEKLPSFTLTLNGPIHDQPKTIWRFSDIDEHWRLSLCVDFVALETTKYTSRSDFISRMQTIYQAAKTRFGISIIDRVGLRYIDRIEFSGIEELLRMMSSEAAGILSTSLAEDAELSLQENVFGLPSVGGKLRAKWGIIPPNSTVDPTAIEPSSDRTWILDLDAFSMRKAAMTVDEIVSALQTFAEKSYSLFRWTVTEEFIRRYGGKM